MVGAKRLRHEGYTLAVLVLTREVGQTIVIGKDIRITVVQVKGDQARIGIDAPRSVPVNRLEVFEELQGANAAASSANTSDLDVLRSVKRKNT
jgi:carbon storage regulator